jgi:hypothetical protein
MQTQTRRWWVISDKVMRDSFTHNGQIPLFEKDTDGSRSKSLYIMGRRNWCRITLQESGGLLFEIRVEKEKGHGETVGYGPHLVWAAFNSSFSCRYSVLAPPPLWIAVKPSFGRGGARKAP